jgi:hypothetical protein
MDDELRIISNSKSSYGNDFEKHILEQYKLYVEMADRISARRMLANSFFVSVHVALVTAFTVMLKEKILIPSFVNLLPFLSVVFLCYMWWKIIKSYRQLNSGKFKVIHAIEQILPIAPYDAEWHILGNGKEQSKYFPLTHIENYIPVCFAILYIALAINLFMNVAK